MVLEFLAKFFWLGCPSAFKAELGTFSLEHIYSIEILAYWWNNQSVRLVQYWKQQPQGEMKKQI